MYKIVYVLFCVIVFMACHKKEISDCRNRICTTESRSIVFTFTDKSGTGVAVKDYSVVNMRTGESVKRNVSGLSLAPGTYIVLDDSYVNKLSAEGDDIKISGKLEATGQTKSTIMKVAGGACACHIQKISGADKLAFD